MRNTRKVISSFALVGLIASSCSSAGDGETSDGPVSVATSEAPNTEPQLGTVAPTTVPTGGWIDGEPTWSGGGDEADAMESGGDLAMSDAATTASAAEPIEGESEGSDPAVSPDSAAEPCIDCVSPEVNNSPLRAGSVDDNDDYAGFLDYLTRLEELGLAGRDFDPRGRSIVTVTGYAGESVAGTLVLAESGDVSVKLRTTADGTARFLPAAYGISLDAEISYTVQEPDALTVTAAAGEDVQVAGSSYQRESPVPLDVLFLLDATGSMGDEIGRLKETIDTVADRIAELEPAPDVRFAMTLYRDEGDSFVTSTYDFTGDIAQFQAALAEVVADGGGDYPEALDEGLAEALSSPAWRDPGEAVQLIFVVADAPPQVGRAVEVPYTDSIRIAIERGIKIFPVASSESDDQAELVFRQLAQATGAPFVFLSNGASGASVGENTDIDSTDYEELALDELVVRLVAEELADLSGGGEVTVPTTSEPSTTNPEGQ